MDYSSENIKIVFYILLWVSFLLFYFKRHKGLSLGLALILLYTTQAIVALPLYNSPDAVSFQFFHKLNYWPFFYLFIMIVISMIPIIRLRENGTKYIEIPSHGVLTFLCIFFPFFSLISIIETIPRLQDGILIIMASNNDSIMNLYEESTSLRTSGMFANQFWGIVRFFINIGRSIGPLLFFSYLIKKNRNPMVLLLLSVSLLQTPFEGIANASRLQLFSQFFILFLLYCFFSPFIKSTDRKAFRKAALVVVSFFFAIFMIITIVRSQYSAGGTGVSSMFSIERYYAEGPLNFNAYCMDANGTREGHKVIPLLLRVIGEKTLTSEELIDKYSYMTIDNKVFSTYVGDFVLDFGPTVAFVIFVILFSFFDFLLNHRRRAVLNYGQIIIVALITRFCSGFYQYGFSNVGGNHAFITMLFLAFVFMLSKNTKNGKELVKRCK